ncbi:MAG TPA: hypothetical protein VME17_08880 [Bryobacteraceae bacterium]|nr:hypothetical protein [Bryobacteraceae bacterium]
MVLFDAAILSIAIDPRAITPSDFRTGQPIPQARERVDALIASLEQDNEAIVIPTPALAEALTTLAEKAIELTEQIEQRACFRIKPFGKRDAIEVAMRTRAAILAGDKREGIADSWQKVKYDRQILAIAKTENVSAIYSTDRGVHEHGKLWGIPVLHLADVPTGASTGSQLVLDDAPEEAGGSS